MSTISQIRPEEQLHILKASRYEPALLTHLQQPIVDIIHTCVPENIGPNAENWYKALDKIHALPHTIPSLPINIHEILTAPWVLGNGLERVTDTNTLWLMPEGTDVDRLAQLCGQGQAQKFLSKGHPDLPNWFVKDLRTSETVEFKESKWVLMSDILPESMNKEFLIQNKMINELKKKSFLNYEMPTFKIAYAANLLKIQADGQGLWTSPLVSRRLTRVVETNIGAISGVWGVQFTLTVGNHCKEGRSQIEVNSCPLDFSDSMSNSARDPEVGIAAVQIGFLSNTESSSRINASDDQSNSCCVLN